MKAKFLPANTTSVIQPMDILENEASSSLIPDIIIKNAVYCSAQSWEELSSNTLRRGWNKLLLNDTSNNNVSIENEEVASTDGIESTTSIVSNDFSDDVPEFDDLFQHLFQHLFQQLGYTSGCSSWQTPEDWVNEDCGDPGFQFLADDEIIYRSLEREI